MVLSSNNVFLIPIFISYTFTLKLAQESQFI